MARKKKKNRCYAYLLTGTGETGLTDSWPACEAVVSGRPARYRGFPTEAEARAWLERGAPYDSRPAPDLPEDAVYFDAGTGGGGTTRARVTDRDGVPLAHLAADHDDLDPEGNVVLPGRTNNYGELLACCLALQVAEALGVLRILGDSRLVLEHWSLGRVSARARQEHPDLPALARRTAALRKAFEARGGRLDRVSGDHNPADLGYHR